MSERDREAHPDRLVFCYWCQNEVPARHATSYNVAREGEYYPKLRWICDGCKRQKFDHNAATERDR